MRLHLFMISKIRNCITAHNGLLTLVATTFLNHTAKSEIGTNPKIWDYLSTPLTMMFSIHRINERQKRIFRQIDWSIPMMKANVVIIFIPFN